ncbi:MAG: bifunctional D-glycero-beta-D-manno-heptose-7-phosphate kinase/D-glycero-beta-D-manno-heptose 1-phosphate adenylyltransferase HldE [Pseudomonadales bacterium]|nr:bifunctional D-glycero-beta-D-manno-heptose-7-phosphate kinase/D-glycero-beta-D-manno-heptose 1-phosphate adenylyltransferase HldE [Pseudomonadales bacterium]
MKLEIPRFKQARVIVIGDVMLDRYWYGGTSRISPEAPVPVVGVNQRDERPGGAANVSLNIAALGATTDLIGVVGDDEAAQSLSESLTSVDVKCDFQTANTKPTITKLRVVSQNQQLLRLDFEELFDAADVDQFPAKLKNHIVKAGALVLSDYGKGALQEPQKLIALARAAKVPVLVDPKGTDFTKYRGATLITPNLKEFEAVVGVCRTEQELVDRGIALLHELKIDALLVTRSEQGMTLLREGKPELHLPARAREVYDVTGAGDTVISVIASSLAAGSSLPQAVALANIAAGLVVAKLGTATVSVPELRRAVQREQGSERGVVSEDQLLMVIEDARAHGEKIVFTNGCFDIIHAGHVGYLEEAGSLGDRLIVAVNSDDSVSRLKGPGRPINPVERRMRVLAGLESVDWVVSFAEDTPENLLKKVRPDVLVKGGDYKMNEIVGADLVNSYGGKVQVLSFIDELSTTAIVEKIKQR